MAHNVCRSRQSFMQAQRKFPSQSKPRRSFFCVTFLLIFALLAHSFENCAAHRGGLAPFGTNAQQIKAQCPNGVDSCELCLPTKAPHQDICDLISESAVLTSSQHPLEHEQVATLAATVAIVPAMPQLIALSGCLHGRAGPPPASLPSVFLRSSLPSRAPPVSI